MRAKRADVIEKTFRDMITIIESRNYKALSVKQPYAEAIANGHKRIEVRSRNTNFRGDLVICASAKPSSTCYPTGVTRCIVELYDVKPVEEFTAEDWAATCIPPDERPLEGFGWLVRNARPVAPVPVKGQLGIYNLVVTLDARPLHAEDTEEFNDYNVALNG